MRTIGDGRGLLIQVLLNRMNLFAINHLNQAHAQLMNVDCAVTLTMSGCNSSGRKLISANRMQKGETKHRLSAPAMTAATL